MNFFLRNLFFKLRHPDAVQCSQICGKLVRPDNTLMPLCDSCIKGLEVYWDLEDVSEHDSEYDEPEGI